MCNRTVIIHNRKILRCLSDDERLERRKTVTTDYNITKIHQIVSNCKHVRRTYLSFIGTKLRDVLAERDYPYVAPPRLASPPHLIGCPLNHSQKTASRASTQNTI